MKKFLIFGAGYVGLPYGLLFSKNHKVLFIDTDKRKVEKINKKDFQTMGINNVKEYKKFFDFKNICASTNLDKVDVTAYDYALICVPTNLDKHLKKLKFDIIEGIVGSLTQLKFDGIIIIKSTVSIGYTESLIEEKGYDSIIFSPEFLREGNELNDCNKPSRIVIGSNLITSKNNEIAKLFSDIASNNPKIFYMGTDEAESVKLFSNTYLAMRVAFFNELDTFSIEKKLSSKNVIEAVSYDKRIGNYYNNPSFGYGGYCLPKDTNELASSFKGIESKLIKSIISSNKKREQYILNEILEKKPKVVGIYKLGMKAESNNYRNSVVISLMHELKKNNIKIKIFDNLYSYMKTFNDNEIILDFKTFESKVDLIVSNRLDETLENCKVEVYSRDIFGNN